MGLPEVKQDRIAFCVFCVGGVFLLWYEACYVMPFYHPDGIDFTETYFHYLVAAFLAFQIYGNMYKLKTTDITFQRETKMAYSEDKGGWKRCEPCNQEIPPRCHHCKVCGKCILKRDHHCWFAACCVGYSNHRYYFVMVVYMVITGLYCNCFNYGFVIATRGPFRILDILWFIAPHAGWFFGFYDFYVLCISLLCSIGFIVNILLIWLFGIQLSQIVSGQTKHEKKTGDFRYNLGTVYLNTKEVLGENMFLVFLSPFVKSKLIEDGNFTSSDSKKCA